MSRKHIRFYIDLVSPFAYLAWIEFHKRLASLELELESELENSKNIRVDVDYVPVFLGSIFKAHAMTAPVAVKREYNKKDMERWADFYKVKVQYPEKFPFNSLYVLKLVLALELEEKASVKEFINQLEIEIWQKGRELSSWKALEKLLGELNWMPEGSARNLLEKAASLEVKEKLRKNNEQAVSQGVFGVPAFLIENELFWGNDRLDFVFRKLRT